MELVTLTKKEFKKFADKHSQITFHQTEEWANLKLTNGWKAHYVGLKDKNKIVAGALLLAKTLPIVRKKMFYSPRGFLIAYNNYNLYFDFSSYSSNAYDNRSLFLHISSFFYF